MPPVAHDRPPTEFGAGPRGGRFTDASGKPLGVQPNFTLPTGLPGLAGTTLHHAVIARNTSTLASEFVSEPSAVKLY